MKKILSLEFFFAFLLFCNAQPFFVWGRHIQNYLLYPVLLFIAIKHRKNEKELNALLFIILTFVVLYCAFQELTFGYYLNYLSLPIMYLINKKECAQVYKRLFELFTLLVGISVICYIINIIIPGIMPNMKISPTISYKDYNYIAYPFFVTPDLPFEFRFHGMFDEAGTNGTITTIFLYIERYNLKKKRNMVLFINGLLSFSFFFILCTLFYFIVSRLDIIIRSLPKLLVVFSVFFILYNETKNDEMIKFYVWDRMSIIDEKEPGQARGDNRTDELFEFSYKNFLASSDVWFGKGRGSGEKVTNDTSSYKLVVYNYGVVWFFFFLFFWIFDIVMQCPQKGRDLLFKLFLISAMIFQRPGILMPFISFMFMNMFPYNEILLFSSSRNRNNNDKTTNHN